MRLFYCLCACLGLELHSNFITPNCPKASLTPTFIVRSDNNATFCRQAKRGTFLSCNWSANLAGTRTPEEVIYRSKPSQQNPVCYRSTVTRPFAASRWKPTYNFTHIKTQLGNALKKITKRMLMAVVRGIEPRLPKWQSGVMTAILYHQKRMRLIFG